MHVIVKKNDFFLPSREKIYYNIIIMIKEKLVLVKNSNATLDDIARQAGVSRMTAYKVINQKGHVRPQNEAAVKKACAELNYQKNAVARALSLNKKHTICVSYFIPFSHIQASSFILPLRKGLDSAYEELKNFHLQLLYDECSAQDMYAQADAICSRFQEGVRDFIVVPYSIPHITDCINDLTAKGARFVTLNRDCPASLRLAYVGCDYLSNGRLCGEILSKTSAPGTLLIIINEHFLQDSCTLDRFTGIVQSAFQTGTFETFERLIVSSADSIQNLLPPYLRASAITAIADLSSGIEQTAACLQKCNKSKPISLVGFDLYPTRAHLLDEYLVDCFVDQNLSQQGYWALKSFFQHIAFEKPISPVIASQSTPMFASNYSDFLAANVF